MRQISLGFVLGAGVGAGGAYLYLSQQAAPRAADSSESVKSCDGGLVARAWLVTIQQSMETLSIACMHAFRLAHLTKNAACLL
jgi:hypothetical protein